MKNSWEEIYKREKRGGGCGGKARVHPDLKKIIKIFKGRKVKRILDLGCGAGRNLVFLAKNNFEVFGIDFSKTGLKIAKEWLKEVGERAKLKLGNIYEKLPYPNSFFDAIVSIRVIHHQKLAKIRKLIKEVKRILRPRGLIFFTVLGREKIPSEMKKKIKFVDKRTYKILEGAEKGLYHFHFNRKIIKEEFKGFKILKIWKDKEGYLAFLGILQKVK